MVVTVLKMRKYIFSDNVDEELSSFCNLVLSLDEVEVSSLVSIVLVCLHSEQQCVVYRKFYQDRC